MALEKSLPVQVALEYVYLMFESAVSRFENAKAQILRLDLESQEIVSKYVEGLVFLCRLVLVMAPILKFPDIDEYQSGLTRWYFETDRYFGQDPRNVKETMKLDLLPLEESARKPDQALTYHVTEY